MRGSVLISLFGLSMAMVGSLVACSGDEEKAATTPSGGEGESCTRRADCSGKLKCFNNVCVTSNSTGGSGGSGNDAGSPGTGGSTGGSNPTGGKGGTTGGSAGKGGTTGGAGGSTGGTAPAPVLGGPGESCTRAADCEADLGCFNNRCAAAPTGEGGDGNQPTLGGGLGETCVVSSDCAGGLACLPASTMTGSVGICVPSETGVAPTGKTCGAECAAAVDCCELPTELHATLGVKSCTELADVLATNAVACASPSVTYSPHCFAQAVYCGSTCPASWACTAGMCTYTADCADSGLVVDGCPTVSRSGIGLVSTCNADKCQPPAVTMFPCDSQADCDNAGVVADDNTDTCVPGECVCYQKSGCYRKCNEDLDCAFGKVCSPSSKLCIPDNQCDTDETCQRQKNDYRAVCTDKVCTVPCERDLDCNPNGLINGSFTQVCEGGTCQALGCTDDAECVHAGDVTNMVANPRKMFCTATTPGMAGVTVSSAITD